MCPLKFEILPPPPMLRDDVEFFRIAEYSGEEPFSITVCLNGLPGIVFQHNQGHSPVEKIVTSTHCTNSIPTLYVYGQMTETGVMAHKAEPYKMTQVILKPHALQSLLGVNAAVLTNGMVELG